MTETCIIDYRAMYDGYWDRPDRRGESSADLREVAERIIATCGRGKVIDIGSGEGFLVGELLANGVDAYGLDVSALVVERANARWPERFKTGSVLALSYSDNAFDTVASTDCLEHLAPADVPQALREVRRVARRFAFLQIATTQDRDSHWHLTVEGRAWWEERCFEAGFRKHPLYYRLNPYEALNHDGWQITLLLEKIHDSALRADRNEALADEALLHRDMLRETGRRSDAHCIRYARAAEWVRPGDTVLDIACGLGYGSHILFQNSLARRVLGVDIGDDAVAYAKAHFGDGERVVFQIGDAQNLADIGDSSIDFIAAFETIEHIPAPEAYLSELKRVLRPAGRLMICAPNNWVDQTGRDPNPHHLHVYDWPRLIAECRRHFLVEKAFAQTAGGAIKCHHSQRQWRDVNVEAASAEGSEWAVLLCMADAVGKDATPYAETIWELPAVDDFHVAAFARDYRNPWLVKSMVAIGLRTQSPKCLADMQQRVLTSAPAESVDYGAALCGRVYSTLGSQGPVVATEYADLVAAIRRYAAIETPSPHQRRWQVSLLYAGGELARKRGDLADADAFFAACAAIDVMPYSPLLGNKTLDALYHLATSAMARGDGDEARCRLLQSIDESKRLATASWCNIYGKPEAPLPFGLAEMAQLFDRASRAAYTLAIIDRGGDRPGMFRIEGLGYYERQLKRAAREVAAADARAQELARQVVAANARAHELAADAITQGRQFSARIAGSICHALTGLRNTHGIKSKVGRWLTK